MLANLVAVLGEILKPKRQTISDQALLRGLHIENGVDESIAYAVLLMDLARIDGTANAAERLLVKHTLESLFPERASESDLLIKTAESILDSFRGHSIFVSKVKEEYPPEERAKLLAVIDQIIAADTHEDGMEKLLKAKFQELLS
jgi:uncharacterized tellurite resistance protein B-like protein